MKRLLIAGAVLCTVAAAGQAQDRIACMSQAQLERDYCLREARAEGYSDRSCYSNYNNQTARCRQIALPTRPNQPIGPIQRSKPTTPYSPSLPRNQR